VGLPTFLAPTPTLPRKQGREQIGLPSAFQFLPLLTGESQDGACVTAPLTPFSRRTKGEPLRLDAFKFLPLLAGESQDGACVTAPLTPSREEQRENRCASTRLSSFPCLRGKVRMGACVTSAHKAMPLRCANR